MVKEFFGTLLEEIGSALKINNLKPDANNSCLIKFKEGVQLQLEMDRSGDYLIIGSEIGSVPAGAYRERVFGQALKANHGMASKTGQFAYSKNGDTLTLFKKFSIKTISAEQIAEFIPFFVEKARIWKAAMDRGELPPLQTSAESSSGMFGLR